jgi:hypothetical protein
MGHEERFPPPRLSDRYGFSKETVARVPAPTEMRRKRPPV